MSLRSWLQEPGERGGERVGEGERGREREGGREAGALQLPSMLVQVCIKRSVNPGRLDLALTQADSLVQALILSVGLFEGDGLILPHDTCCAISVSVQSYRYVSGLAGEF